MSLHDEINQFLLWYLLPFQIEFDLEEYSKEAYGEYFMMSKRSGILGLQKALDREVEDHYSLTITARDLGPNSIPTDCMVYIHVLDENDNSPVITVNTLKPESQIARIAGTLF